tara:strand:- start:436 stop:900 length:465 start_codon:yes stop_codon:yes gene_type:complete
MKKCFKCGAEKPLTDFYKHPQMLDGTVNKCKDCNKRDVKENRKINADYYREYDAKRFQEDPKVRARHRRYAQTDAGRASLQKSRDNWDKINPDKKAAHTILNNAVRDGRAEKPNNCSRCGASGRIEGHHHDYTRPLDVLWLCRQCHVNEHKETF